MNSVVRTVGGRVDPAPVTALVALGDLACIGAFVVAGEISHDVDPVANPLYVTETAIPFLIGWTLVALLGGLYAADARAHYHVDPAAHDEMQVAGITSLFDAAVEVREDGISVQTRDVLA